MFRRSLLLASLSVLSVSAAGYGLADTAPPKTETVVDILDKHCARCHEVGKLKAAFQGKPKGNFGYTLDLDQMIKKGRIKPGNAAGSEIYAKIVKGDMPKDIDDACNAGDVGPGTYCGPSKDEIVALGAYIDGMKTTPVSRDVAIEQSPVVKPAIGPVPVGQPSVEQIPVGQPPVGQAPVGQPVAAAHGFIPDSEIIRAISLDMESLPPTTRANARYLTLTNLYNAGDDPKDMEVFRAGLAKLVNSLSSQGDPQKLVAVDEAKTVLRIDIAGLGWDPKLWDQIAALDPYLVTYDDPQFRSLQTELKTTAPFLRGDWFAHVASRPPLYNQILALPDTLDGLEKKLGLDTKRDTEAFRVARAGFQDSGVSQNNRMIERHTIASGTYWQSFDFASSDDRRNFFQFPLGPQGVLGDVSKQFGFTHDGGEIIFSLPNGFHAYYLATSKGAKLDKGPTNIVQDPSKRDFAVTNGISCMGCHDQGIKFNDKRPGQPLDQVRPLVLQSGTFSKQVKDDVTALFPEPAVFEALMKSDAKRFAAALDQAGVPMNLKLSGVEMVNSLFDRFERKLNARLAAAELGMTEAEFMQKLDAAGTDAYDLKLRLAQDVVPRDQFEALFAVLVKKTTNNTPVDLVALKQTLQTNAGDNGAKLVDTALSAPRPPEISKTFDLAFFADKTTAKVGEKVVFKVKSALACSLTLIDTDNQGRSVVLFPNKFSHANAITANVTFEVPGPKIGGFEFTAEQVGQEHVTAICDASASAAVIQDFSKEDYTSFQSQGALIDSMKKARLLGIHATGASPANPSPAAAKVPDPKVPITAQTAVVIDVIAN